MPLRWSMGITPDIGPLLARLANADAVAWNNVRTAIRQGIDGLALELAAASPRGSGSSGGPKISESWMVFDEGFRFVLRNRAPHLQYVLKGNNYPNQGGGDGWIYPVRAAALVFTIDGETFVRRRVRASQPNDFVTPIVRTWRVTQRGLIGAAMRTTTRWLAGH